MTARKRLPKAAALHYDQGSSPVPRVVARGQGHVAERILELARAHNVPIHQDPALVEVLATLDVDTTIPPALYLAVAQVLGVLVRAGLLTPPGR